METVVIVLMILVSFNFLVKLTYAKVWWAAIITVGAALFVGLMWPYAIEQSRTQIDEWLSNPSLMLDTSVILTIEVVIQMSFCMLAAHIMTAGKLNRRTVWLYRILRWFPGVLILPVLFSVLVWLIFAFPGVSFSLIAWSMAGATLLLIPAGILFLLWLLPEKDLRLEILFLTNALTAILGIIATVNGRTAVVGVSEVNWMAVAGVIAIIAAGALVGLIIHKRKRIKHLKGLFS